MSNWKEYVMDARSQEPPVPWSEIGRELEEVFPDLTYEQCKQKARDFYRKQPEYKGKPKYEKKPEKPKGVKVVQNLVPETFEVHAKDTITFGVVSDTHICSKWTQLSHLHSFYNMCAERGITDIYHAGDITDGTPMRTGHEYELYCIGVEDQVEEVCRVYPKVPGVTTHFITGNHDAAATKRCGADVGKMIASRRPDMKYLGRDIANVQLTDKCVMRLSHPWTGSAYALSYRLQKMVDGMPPRKRPDILIVGHFHKKCDMEYGGVQCLLAGSFEGFTPFMEGKGLDNAIGGYIVTVDFNEDGTIKRWTADWYPFEEITDDYKTWR